jgi:GT2 family glycosyltransferase
MPSDGPRIRLRKAALLPQAQPLVYAVILNWNSLADTRECLASLRGIDYPNYRIIIVDNGSEEGEVAALRSEFGGAAHLIESPANLGFAGGANLGIQYALADGSDYVLLLNNDTTVDPRFLSELVHAAESLDGVAAVCPRAYYYDEPEVIYSTGGSVSLWTGTARQVGNREKDTGQFDAIDARDYADGVCILMSRRAIESVGLLDEDYFAYWEETDWCARARKSGLQCYYVPDSRIWHKAARVQSPTKQYRFLFRRNALMFVRKRGTPLHVITAVLAHVFFFGPRYFLTHPASIARAPAELRALLWHTSNRHTKRPLL